MGLNIQPVFSNYSLLVCSLGGLPSSAAGVGRQTTMVDNTVTKYIGISLNVKITLGTSPTPNKSIYLYLLEGNGTNWTDGAGASDAALTVVNALPIGVMTTGTAPTTGTILRKSFVITPFTEWGIAIVHDSGVNLDATGSNHVLSWAGYKYEVVMSN